MERYREIMNHVWKLRELVNTMQEPQIMMRELSEESETMRSYVASLGDGEGIRAFLLPELADTAKRLGVMEKQLHDVTALCQEYLDSLQMGEKSHEP